MNENTQIQNETSRPEPHEAFLDRPANVDVLQGEHGYVVRADLPGTNKEDISINLEDGELEITALRSARSYGASGLPAQKYRRRFRLPDDIDADRVEAKLDAGVLSVTLPRAEAKKPRQIAVG